METGCEDGRWMELAQDRVQWWSLVLAVLNRCVVLPESWLAICNVYIKSVMTLRLQNKLQLFAVFQQENPPPSVQCRPVPCAHTDVCRLAKTSLSCAEMEETV